MKVSKAIEIFHEAKWRLCVWLLSGNDFKGHIMDFYNSWEGSLSRGPRRTKTLVTDPPHQDTYKFNVDNVVGPDTK